MLDETGFNVLYGDKEHYLGIIRYLQNRPSRNMDFYCMYKKIGYYKDFNGKQKLYLHDYMNYLDLLEKQRLRNGKDNIFVHCYPRSGVLNYFVLDFDGDDGVKTVALMHLNKVYKLLKRKGFNCVRVSSGSKGYHLYVQIPCTDFLKDSDVLDNKTYFTTYWQTLIEWESDDTYSTLDKNHWRNGLGCNIRLIGSIHPRTGNRVSLFDEDCFLPQDILAVPPAHIHALEIAYNKAANKVMDRNKAEVKRHKMNKRILKRTGVDLESIDLRDVFMDYYGGYFSRHHDGYDHYRCPFHDDHNPSLMVYSDYFICHGCDYQGRIYRLIKDGYVRLGDD